MIMMIPVFIDVFFSGLASVDAGAVVVEAGVVAVACVAVGEVETEAVGVINAAGKTVALGDGVAVTFGVAERMGVAVDVAGANTA